MANYTVEHRYEIHDDTDGSMIRVGPDQDALNLIRISFKHRGMDIAEDELLVIPAALARLLAGVLMRAADDADHQRSQDEIAYRETQSPQ